MKLKSFSTKKEMTSTTDEVTKLLEFLGISTNTSATALSEATYYACLKFLAESIGKLPLKLQIDTGENGIVSGKGHKFYNVLRYRPNPYMTATTFWGTVEMCRNHYGNALVYIKDYQTKNPTLWILDPERTEIYYDKNKMFSDIPEMWYIVTNPATGQKAKYSSAEVMHFKTSMTLDGIIGLSVREQLRTVINGGITSQNMLNRLYDSDMTSRAVVQYTGNLSDSNAEALSKGFERYAKGQVEGSKLFLPVPFGCTISPLNLKLTDAQFLELRKYSALQIASAFGIKPNQINDYEKSSYASAEAQQLAFYIDTSIYILKQYEDEIAYKCLSADDISKGYEPYFNVDVVLRGDSKTQAEVLTSYVSNGIKTPNEARQKLRAGNLNGGDKLYMNGSNIPIEMAGAQYVKGGE